MVPQCMHKLSVSCSGQPVLARAFQWKLTGSGVARLGIRYTSKKVQRYEQITSITRKDGAKDRGEGSNRVPPASPQTDDDRLRTTRELPVTFKSPHSPTTQESRHELSSTRPAPLILPEGPDKEEDGRVALKSRISHIIKTGKAYLGFYKTGFLNVWSNYKEYSRIRKNLRGININRSIREGTSPEISRHEFQMCLRTRHDVGVLIPFGLLFLVCGEFTPLVILAIGTSIVPYPCRIPRQVNKNMQKMIAAMNEKSELAKGEESSDDFELHCARIYGLNPFGLSIANVPVLGPWLHSRWITPRLEKLFDGIVCDAMLIVREGGAQRLEVEELFDFGVKIRDRDTIVSLLSHGGSGPDSTMPRSEIKRIQRKVQAFADAVSLATQRREPTGPYDAADVFFAGMGALNKVR